MFFTNTKFFSGFCFQNEKEIFEHILRDSDFCVAGFSFGAIKAFEFALESIENNKRIDFLQLLSPSFFQDKDEKYKRLQAISFSKNSQQYIKTFYNSLCDSPDFVNNENMSIFKKNGSIEELQELLWYVWDKNKIEKLLQNGVQIEIFLGKKDKIIESQAVLDFFLPYANIYFSNNSGHLLEKLK